MAKSIAVLLRMSLILCGCSSTAAQTGDELFTQYEIITGSTNTQTVLAGHFLNNDTAELAIVHIDNGNNRILRLYEFDGDSWELAQESNLGPDVLLIDTASFQTGDRLLTIGNGRVNRFDPVSSQQVTLLEFSQTIRSTDSNRVPQIDISRDVNQDGLDDLIVPDHDGFLIALQNTDGSFNQPLQINAPEPFLDHTAFDASEPYRNSGLSDLTIPWYLSRLHSIDYNLDGLNDLVFWHENQFQVHYQSQDRQFATEAVAFNSNVSFQSDGVYSHVFAFDEDGMFSLLTGLRGRSRHTVLYSFLDMNDDGVSDLVTQSLEGRSLLNQRISYQVHLGSAAGGRLQFSADANMDLSPQASAEGGAPWVIPWPGWRILMGMDRWTWASDG